MPFPEKPRVGLTTECVCSRIIDGDTIEIEVRKKVMIRLKDCKMPEIRTKDEDEKAKGLAIKQKLIDYLTENGADDILKVKLLLLVPGSERNTFADDLTLDRVLGYLWKEGDEVSLNERLNDWLNHV